MCCGDEVGGWVEGRKVTGFGSSRSSQFGKRLLAKVQNYSKSAGRMKKTTRDCTPVLIHTLWPSTSAVELRKEMEGEDKGMV
jgi:hypothetical protein